MQQLQNMRCVVVNYTACLTSCTTSVFLALPRYLTSYQISSLMTNLHFFYTQNPLKVIRTAKSKTEKAQLLLPELQYVFYKTCTNYNLKTLEPGREFSYLWLFCVT